MSKLNKTPQLRIPTVVSGKDLAATLHKLVKEGHLSVKALEALNAELRALSKVVRQKAIKALKVDESKVEEKNTKILSLEQKEELLSALEVRFHENMHRHQGVDWSTLAKRLQEGNPENLWSLNEMERTGGEPDVVDFKPKTGAFRFREYFSKTPESRVYLAYDQAGEADFRTAFPKFRCDGNVLDTAAEMGIEVLDEAEYRKAQEKDKLDLNSWVYVKTPPDVRKRGLAFHGSRSYKGVHISVYPPYDCYDVGPFRGGLWV